MSDFEKAIFYSDEGKEIVSVFPDGTIVQ